MPDVSGGSIVWDLTLDDKGFAAGLSKAKSEVDKTAKSINKSFSSMSKNIVGSIDRTSKKLTQVGGDMTKSFTAPILGGVAAVGVLASKAGKFESVLDSYNSMVSGFEIGGDQLVANVKKAVSGTVSELDIMASFITASSLIGAEALGSQGENFERMAILSKKAARATGQNVDFMMDSLVKGVGRGSVVLLDNLGITVDATKVYADYADQVGKSVKEISAAEKKQALLNAVLAKGESQYKEVKTTAGGVSSSFARMRVAIEESSIAIGLALIPVVKDFLEVATPIIVNAVPKIVAGITRVVSAFQNLSPTMKIIIAAVTGFLAVIGPVLIVVGAIGSGVVALAGFFGLLASVIGSVVSVVGTIIAVLNPIGLIILGITALVALFAAAWKNNWLGIGDAMNGVVSKIKSTFNDLNNSITSTVDSVKNSITGFVNFIKSVPAIITGAFDLILKGDFKGEFGRALGLSEDSPIIANILGFRKKLIDVFKGIMDIPKLILKGDVTGAFLRTFGLTEDGPIIQGFLNLRTSIIETLTSLKDGIVTIIQAIASPFIWVWNNIVFPIMFLAAAVISRVLFEIGKVFFSVLTTTWNIVKSVFTSILNTIVSVFNLISAFISTVLTFLLDVIIIPRMMAMLETFTMIWTAIKEFFIATWNGIVAFLTPIVETIKQIFTSLWQGVVQILTALWAKAVEIWTNISKSINQKATEAKTKTTTTIGELRTRLSEIFNEIWENIKAIGQKIFDAIVDPFIKAKKKVEEIAQAIKDAAAKISPFHKESPSLVENVIKGIGIIKDEFASLGDISFPSIASAAPDFEGQPAFSAARGGERDQTPGNTSQNITVNIGQVNDEADIDMISREIAFRTSLLPL